MIRVTATNIMIVVIVAQETEKVADVHIVFHAMHVTTVWMKNKGEVIMETCQDKIKEYIETLKQEQIDLEDDELQKVISEHVVSMEEWLDQIKSLEEIEKDMPTPFDFMRIKFKHQFDSITNVTEQLMRLIKISKRRKFKDGISIIIDNTKD